VPYPPDSLRQSGSRQASSGERTRLPYSKVWVAALRLGYTRRDLAALPYGEVLFDLAATNDDTTAGQEQGPDVTITKATQEDIRTMLG